MNARLRSAVALAITLGYFANSLVAGEPIVLYFDELQADDVVGNPLEVQSKIPFRYALFQCTTEQEGFDDLEFEPAPAPESTPAAEAEESSDSESQPEPAES